MELWWLLPVTLIAIIITLPLLCLAIYRAACWVGQTLLLAVIIMLAMHLMKEIAARPGA